MKRARIQDLLKNGRRIRTGCFNLSYRPGIPQFTIGFAARGDLGHAAARNRVKRAIRAGWRHQFSTGDWFFVLKHPVMRISSEELRKLLDVTARKTGSDT